MKNIKTFEAYFAESTMKTADELEQEISLIKDILKSVGGNYYSEDGYGFVKTYGKISKWMDDSRNSWVEIVYVPEKESFFIEKAFENEYLDDEYGFNTEVIINFDNTNETIEKLSYYWNFLTSDRRKNLAELNKNI